MEVYVPNLRSGYVQLVDLVRAAGRRAPVGRSGAVDSMTTEILGFTLVLEDPTDALPVGVGRKLNKAIAAAEAIQLIGGWSDPEWLCRIAPNMKTFTDTAPGRSTPHFHGAYGPRLKHQIEPLIKRIQADPTTRQAVLTVWDPRKDGDDGPRDIPCTVMLQFFVRDGALEMHTHMRSNDVWWGLAYDAFQFTQLQITLARFLGYAVGRYMHTAGSLHLYARDSEAAQSLHEPTGESPAPDVADGLWRPGDSDWWSIRGRTDDIRWADTAEPAWYADALRKHAT